MSWFLRSKLDQTSGYLAQLTLPIAVPVAAQSASAGATYEVPLWCSGDYTAQTGLPGPGTNISTSAPFTGDPGRYVILHAYLVPITGITGGGATVQATANIQLYDSTGASVGTLFSLLYSTGVNATALAQNSLGSPSTTVRNIAQGCVIHKNETLSFQWVQSGTTGLALPAATIVLDLI